MCRSRQRWAKGGSVVEARQRHLSTMETREGLRNIIIPRTQNWHRRKEARAANHQKAFKTAFQGFPKLALPKKGSALAHHQASKARLGVRGFRVSCLLRSSHPHLHQHTPQREEVSRENTDQDQNRCFAKAISEQGEREGKGRPFRIVCTGQTSQSAVKIHITLMRNSLRLTPDDPIPTSYCPFEQSQKRSS